MEIHLPQHDGERGGGVTINNRRFANDKPHRAIRCHWCEREVWDTEAMRRHVWEAHPLIAVVAFPEDEETR